MPYSLYGESWIGENRHGGLVYNGEVYKYGLAAPYFGIENEGIEPLAFFEDGTVAAALKDNGSFKTVYVATCNLPSDLLRDILKIAEVFVYSECSKVYTYTNSKVLGVYNATDGDAVINVKQDGVYRDLLNGITLQSRENKLTVPKAEINAYLLIKE